MDFTLTEIIVWILVFAFSISVHEASHALSAYLLGDHTAKHHGRLTLNPMQHIDPLGLLFLIIARFGWAKPVPVNPKNFSNPKFHYALVAASGPLSNIILAYFSLSLLAFLSPNIPLVFAYILEASYLINVLLAAFNLIPLKPLDGESILALFIPRKYQEEYENFANHGPLILFGSIAVGFVFHINILWLILGPIISVLRSMIEFLVLF